MCLFSHLVWLWPVLMFITFCLFRWAHSVAERPDTQEQCEGPLPELSDHCGRVHQAGMSVEHRGPITSHPCYHWWDFYNLDNDVTEKYDEDGIADLQTHLLSRISPLCYLLPLSHFKCLQVMTLRRKLKQDMLNAQHCMIIGIAENLLGYRNWSIQLRHKEKWACALYTGNDDIPSSLKYNETSCSILFWSRGHINPQAHLCLARSLARTPEPYVYYGSR